MPELRRQILLTIATAAVAALILTPIFFGLKLLLDAGLGITFITVVGLAILVGYLLRRETTG